MHTSTFCMSPDCPQPGTLHAHRVTNKKKNYGLSHLINCPFCDGIDLLKVVLIVQNKIKLWNTMVFQSTVLLMSLREIMWQQNSERITIITMVLDRVSSFVEILTYLKFSNA